MRIALVGGGSGGHFYPLMAVADALNESGSSPDLYYFGPAPYDLNALEKHGVVYKYCPAGKMREYRSFQNFTDIFVNIFGIFIALWKLFWVYPDAVFSKGGFTSVPVVIAAKILFIPIVIHESDAVPGKANKIAAPLARYIGIAHDDAAQYFKEKKTALVGIPIRSELKQPIPNALQALGMSDNKPLIYVTGGSLGAERLNNILVRSLAELLPHYRIFHQTGETHADEIRLAVKSLLGESPLIADYYVEGRIDGTTVALLLNAADLVISRAGSTTLFEVAAVGKPAIVVPIPEDVSRDQRSNAYAYARGGAAVVLEESNLSTTLLAQEISSIINDPVKKEHMAAEARKRYVPGAEHKLAEILISIGHEHGS